MTEDYDELAFDDFPVDDHDDDEEGEEFSRALKHRTSESGDLLDDANPFDYDDDLDDE